ncbi:Monothiol glutaredoxin-S5 [Hordeum vulgare]|nr:Monothiol glutaredoxin-S5 [Hordeum vulgare]
MRRRRGPWWGGSSRSEQAEAEGAGGQEGVPARGDGGEAVRRAVAKSPVLVVGRRGCCLSHVVKRLLQGLGVNPAVHEVADEAEHAAVFTGDEVVVALPAVFVGALALALGLDGASVGSDEDPSKLRPSFIAALTKLHCNVMTILSR